MIELLRRRMMMAQKSGGGLLPSGYTQYDWVQCDDTTATSYISVDFYATENTWTFEGSFARTGTYKSDYSDLWIFTQIVKSSQARNYGFGRHQTENNGKLAFNYNGRTNQGGYSGVPTTLAAIGEWHTFVLGPTEGVTNGGTLVIDGTETKSYTVSAPTAANSNVKLLAGFPCRMGRFKSYNNNVLYADLIPAVRNSDSVVGFYDIVRETFYPPTGEATFTAGNGMEDFNT